MMHLGEGSTQSGEPRLRWTHDREHCAVSHANENGDCPDCEAWLDHYYDYTSEPSFEQALDGFYHARDRASELKLDDLELEIDEVDLEIEALNLELERVKAEMARVQQGQRATHVLRQIRETLGQVLHDSEIEDAHSGASLAELPSNRRRKRPRHNAPHTSLHDRHTTQTTNQVIYISSDSDKEHVPMPAPIVR